MLKRVLSFIMILVLCVFAAIAAYAEEEQMPLIFDEAGIVEAGDEALLLAKLENIRTKYGIDVAVAVISDLEGADIAEYTDLYYDVAKFGADGVLLLFCADTREAHILSVGYGETAVTEVGRNYIFDEITYEMGENDYAAAFNEYADLSVELIDRAKAGDPYNKEPFGFGMALVISLGLGFIVAFIVTGSMKGQLKSVRAQHAAANYQRAGSLAIVNASEYFLYSKVDRVRKETQNSSSSSGGRSGTTRQF